MDGADLLLQLTACLASFAQAVTGVGFAMIAGPVILVVLGDPSAVLISTLMSWLIAAVLCPVLWRGADMGLVGRLCLGTALGLPAGVWLLAVSGIDALKALAGLVVGALTLTMVLGAPGMRRPGRAGDVAYGALAGWLGGCLAMPGPTTALRLTATGHDKVAVRATMVAYFVLAFPVIFLAQAAAGGLTAETLRNAAALAPATLAGLALGNLAAGRIGERLFRRAVLAFLFASAASLLGGAAWSRLAA